MRLLSTLSLLAAIHCAQLHAYHYTIQNTTDKIIVLSVNRDSGGNLGPFALGAGVGPLQKNGSLPSTITVGDGSGHCQSAGSPFTIHSIVSHGSSLRRIFKTDQPFVNCGNHSWKISVKQVEDRGETVELFNVEDI